MNEKVDNGGVEGDYVLSSSGSGNGLWTPPNSNSDSNSPVSQYYNSYSYLSAPNSSKVSYTPLYSTLTHRSTRRPIPINLNSTSSFNYALQNFDFDQNSKNSQNFEQNPKKLCNCSCCCIDLKWKCEEISRLREEIARVSSQRDALAIQVEQLNMEILAGELGRLETSSVLTPKNLTPKNNYRPTSGNFASSMGQGQSVSVNGFLSSPSRSKFNGCMNSQQNHDGEEDEIYEEGPTLILDEEQGLNFGSLELCEADTTTTEENLIEVEEDNDNENCNDDVIMISAHLIPQSVDDDVKLSSTYSSGEMTRLSSSSSSSSASSSPVLFTQTQSQGSNNFHHDSNEENGEGPFVDNRRYGAGLHARDAALVIQRAYRRYSMVKEFQRIKTERRLSRRINNNVVGSSSSPPVNSCDICIDVHPEVPHIHSNILTRGLEVPEDDLLEERSSDQLPQNADQDLPEVTELDVQVDQTLLVSQNHQHRPQGPTNKGYYPGQSQSQLMQVQVQQGQQNHRHHHHYHHHQTSSSRFPEVSSRQFQNQGQGPPQVVFQHRNHIPSSSVQNQSQNQSHIHPHHQQQQISHHNLQYSQSNQHISPQQPILSHNPNSAPGLLMVKGQNVSVNGSSVSTTPLTNVSPNLSTSSVGSGGISGGKPVGATEESEIIRKRLYRVGLNLFNKKPEVGVTYLVKKKFLEGSPPAVARFLISRKGLSKQIIGEYLTNLQSPYSMSCLEHFVNEIDLSSMPVDLALRKFQCYYRMPGEAQKIERLMESFSRRYGVCNPHVVSQFRNGADTVFVLAFAIIMLNTDLHTPHLKQDRRMKLDDFIKNLRGVDDGGDIDREILVGIYDRIKSTEFKTGSDHVTQVMKVQQTIVGKKPNLAVPHRRLVCYCRLYEVPDTNKKEKVGCHQREVFLFNDLLVLTKIFHKKRNSVTYSFRQSYPLGGITLGLFSNQYYEHGLSLKRGDTVLLNLNARNEHDRAKFAEDLREAIAESDEMQRIETLSKENRDRDSGVDVGKIKRFSNSLLDINDQCKPVRRGSCGSLDSGMSVSFQSDETHGNTNPLQSTNFPAHQHQGSTCSSSSSSSQNSHK